MREGVAWDGRPRMCTLVNITHRYGGSLCFESGNQRTLQFVYICRVCMWCCLGLERCTRIRSVCVACDGDELVFGNVVPLRLGLCVCSAGWPSNMGAGVVASRPKSVVAARRGLSCGCWSGGQSSEHCTAGPSDAKHAWPGLTPRRIRASSGPAWPSLDFCLSHSPATRCTAWIPSLVSRPSALDNRPRARRQKQPSSTQIRLYVVRNSTRR